MFKINDYIMYGMTGVCKVVDITNETFINNLQREYYVLNPVYSNTTVIKTPVDNEKIQMRKIISKDDVHLLINDIPNNEPLWIDDERSRKEQFKTMLKSGECSELLKLTRAVYDNKEYMQSIGKKSHQLDLDVMTEAERLLNEEFAVVLNIEPSEVASYISDKIQQ